MTVPTDDGEAVRAEVYRLMDEAYAEALKAAQQQLLGDLDNWVPIGILDGLPEIETEGQRVTRELVPLVRAAATEAASPERWLA